MTNTMADLRREVATRLRDTLHGREIDTIEKGMPEVEHMLGIVPIGAISTPEAESGTILDPQCTFWQEYHKDVNTRTGAEKQIESAMHSLREDGIFQVTEPYGEDAGIMYVEVEEMDESNEMTTICTECGSQIFTNPELKQSYSGYALAFDLDCENCDFGAWFGKNLNELQYD